MVGYIHTLEKDAFNQHFVLITCLFLSFCVFAVIAFGDAEVLQPWELFLLRDQCVLLYFVLKVNGEILRAAGAF